MVGNIDKLNCFIPLDRDSQNTKENVLFFDRSLSDEILDEVADVRFKAAYHLLDCVGVLDEQPTETDIPAAILTVTRILLSDANSLLKVLKTRE